MKSEREIERAKLLMQQCFRKVYPLSEVAMDKLLSIFKLAVIRKEDDFVEAGEIVTQFAFVVDGILRSYCLTPNGQERNKHFFLSGDVCYPIVSLATRQPSPIYVEAMTDTLVLRAENSRLQELYETSSELSTFGRKYAELGWISKERRELQFLMLTAPERYKIFLEEYPDLDKRVSQYHIASYLGVTPVQLSRIRRSMKIPLFDQRSDLDLNSSQRKIRSFFQDGRTKKNEH